MQELTGRRVRVTGACWGIVQATARALAGAAATVACLARRTERMRALAGGLGHAAVVAADRRALRRGEDEGAEVPGDIGFASEIAARQVVRIPAAAPEVTVLEIALLPTAQG